MGNKRRVVITGLGIVSPVGLSVAESWGNILAGNSGIGEISHFDVSAFSTRIGGSIKNFDVTEHIPAKEAKKMDPFIHYGIAAANQAIEDANLQVSEDNAHRIGVAIGSGIGGLFGIEKGYDRARFLHFSFPAISSTCFPVICPSCMVIGDRISR